MILRLSQDSNFTLLVLSVATVITVLTITVSVSGLSFTYLVMCPETCRTLLDTFVIVGHIRHLLLTTTAISPMSKRVE